MAVTVNWPATLPDDPDQNGFSEQPPDITEETPMDSGSPKVTAIDTDGDRLIPITQGPWTSEQVDIFDAFFMDDLAGGAVQFNGTHPRRKTSAVCMIKGGQERPRYTPAGGHRYWVSYTLVIIPTGA